MNVLIIEDESLAGKKIASLVQEIDTNLEILAIIKSVEGAVDWLSSNDHPDLIITDIKLLDGVSFEIFQQVEYNNQVIFTTAYDQYAIKAFELNSIDYLLKPVSKDKLEAALNKWKKNRNQSDGVEFSKLLNLIEHQTKEYKSRFLIRSGQKIAAIPVENIAYFYSLNKLTYIMADDGKKYPYDQSLEEIDEQLDPSIFFKANRKYIVRFSAISEIHPYFKGRVKISLSPETDNEIVISSERTPYFKKWLDQ